VLGPGVNTTNDWIDLAEQTGGAWDPSVDAAIIESYITADCT